MNMHTSGNACFLPGTAAGIAGALWLGLALAGCGGDSCPEGKVERGGRCVTPTDAGSDAMTPTDGGMSSSEGGTSDGDSGMPDDGGSSPRPDAGEPNPCDPSPCAANATCEVQDAQAVCTCNPGYEGDGQTCERNECLPLEPDGTGPCGEHTTCEDPSSEEGDFTCSCEEGYRSCDGDEDPTPGCETHVAADPANCGACGYACAGDLACGEGQCEQAAAKLASGGDTACALVNPPDSHDAYELRCWGSNFSNQLRDNMLGTGADAYDDVPVSMVDVDNIREVVVGGDNHNDNGFVCALDGGSDDVLCWGSNHSYALGTEEDTVLGEIITRGLVGPVQLAADYTHVCSLSATGSVACWGGNGSGQLGRQTDPEGSATAAALQISGLGNVAQIDAGGHTTCARRHDGTVDCWGMISADASPALTSIVAASDGASLSDATHIAVGGDHYLDSTAAFHACAIRENGDLVCWGFNVDGSNSSFGGGEANALGLRQYATISDLSNVIDVTVGSLFICAVEQSGQVYCWGKNPSGLLIPGQPADQTVTAPEPIAGLDDAIDVAAGHSHACARRRNGQVVCWGHNGFGQHGNGTTQTSVEPSPVRGMP